MNELGTPQHHITFFLTSEIKQPEELTEFLKNEMTGTPFNKYCIDCKKNQTSHFLVWLGTFVCQGCAIMHLNLPHGCQSKSYVKEVYKDHWDDYQLKSL